MKKTTYRKQRKKDWFKLKRYVHIGNQLEPRDRSWLTPYVMNPEAIEKHIFYPFIHTKIKTRRYRRATNIDGTKSKMRVSSKKNRPLSYSNHIDAKVFSYYSEMLTKEYEKLIEELNFSECVTAYRRIKLDKDRKKSRNKCNIDFANDIFELIKKRRGEDLVAIAFDIESFFDNLDHKLLKQKWRQVIRSGLDLPKDHYNIYRNITHFSYINEADLFNLFKDRLITQKLNKGTGEIISKKKRVERKRYFRKENVVAYCDTIDIKKIRSKGIIKSNKHTCEDGVLEPRTKGIPQGSPISATLANIYMIDFDMEANEFLKSIGGAYRRYSDDMVVICSVEYETKVIELFESLANKNKLNIQDKKTQVFHFKYDIDNRRHFCYERNMVTKKLNSNRSFEYLGFQFDGFYVMIKNAK